MDDKYGQPRIRIKAIKQHLVALKTNYRLANERMISLAASVRKDERVAKNIGMDRELHTDSELSGEIPKISSGQFVLPGWRSNTSWPRSLERRCPWPVTSPPLQLTSLRGASSTSPPPPSWPMPHIPSSLSAT